MDWCSSAALQAMNRRSYTLSSPRGKFIMDSKVCRALYQQPKETVKTHRDQRSQFTSLFTLPTLTKVNDITKKNEISDTGGGHQLAL